jgi:hypothetical protein
MQDKSYNDDLQSFKHLIKQHNEVMLDKISSKYNFCFRKERSLRKSSGHNVYTIHGDSVVRKDKPKKIKLIRENGVE